MKQLSSIALTIIMAATASMSYAGENVVSKKGKTPTVDKVATKATNNFNANICRDLKFGGLARTTSLIRKDNMREDAEKANIRIYEDENGRVDLYLKAMDMAEDLFFETIAITNENNAYKTSYISELHTSWCEEKQERIIQL